MNWENLVVKICIKSIDIDFNKPLNNTSISNSSGTGFFIAKNLILTCYHVVKYARNIEIIFKQTTTLNGEILHIFPDDDLAIIIIEEDLPSIDILMFKEIHEKKNHVVYSIGFPLSNDNIIETKGIISGYRKSLIQTDATLNPGNSGGPLVFFDETVKQWFIIGINVSKLSGNAENTGLAVPCYRYNILKEYISKKIVNIINSKTKEYAIINKPLWQFDYQLIKQESLRNFIFNSDDLSIYVKKKIGVRITILNEKNYLFNYFKKDDILLSINNNDIDLNGYIKFDFFPEKISLASINLWFVNDDILNVKIFDFQSKKIKNVVIKLAYYETNLINYYSIKNIITPSYFIENNNLILSIFTQQHLEDSSNLELKMQQIIKLFNRFLYKQNLFTVYLTGLNPNLYQEYKKFNKFPIGDIIVEINNNTFDDYDSFMKIVKNPIKSIKTIENKFYFVD